MNLPQIKIGEKTTRFPIIQGGMGVGVSLSKLASSVANAGGIGVISGVQVGFNEDDFDENTLEANKRALRNEIRRAKDLSPNGIIGVNFMVAMENYDEMVRLAVEEGIDLIISGAGLPSNLPELVKGSNTKIAPIVSSGKAASLITKLWIRRYDYVPDLIIAEGPLAGGHLGFSFEELEEDNIKDLDLLLEEVLVALKPFEEKHGIKIPVIPAGGISIREDVLNLLDKGASGVQIGTLFVASHECDASIEFKEEYLKASKDDITIMLSPVGLPGRAILNPFLRRTLEEKEKIERCFNCLIPCKPSQVPFCISNALIQSVNGNVDRGLVFIGAGGYELKELKHVKDIIRDLF